MSRKPTRAQLARAVLCKLQGRGHQWWSPPDKFYVWKSWGCTYTHYSRSCYAGHHIGDMCENCGIGKCHYCEAVGWFGALFRTHEPSDQQHDTISRWNEAHPRPMTKGGEQDEQGREGS